MSPIRPNVHLLCSVSIKLVLFNWNSTSLQISAPSRAYFVGHNIFYGFLKAQCSRRRFCTNNTICEPTSSCMEEYDAKSRTASVKHVCTHFKGLRPRNLVWVSYLTNNRETRLGFRFSKVW